jgi:hypothetical protein
VLCYLPLSITVTKGYFPRDKPVVLVYVGTGLCCVALKVGVMSRLVMCSKVLSVTKLY